MPQEPPLPAPLPGDDIDRPLAALMEHRMLAPARRAGYELRLVGATVLPQRQTIERTKWGTWLFVDPLEDPTAREYHGRIPIPKEQLTKLTEIHRQGAHADVIRMAHQLPDSYRIGDPLPQLVPDRPDIREKDERLRLWLTKAGDIFKGAAASLAATGAGLDPIILGGVKHPERPVVGWCVLAQWEWK